MPLRLDVLGGQSGGDAQQPITRWVYSFSNAVRSHTTVGITSPINYELVCQVRWQRTESTGPRKSDKCQMIPVTIHQSCLSSDS